METLSKAEEKCRRKILEFCGAINAWGASNIEATYEYGEPYGRVHHAMKLIATISYDNSVEMYQTRRAGGVEHDGYSLFSKLEDAISYIVHLIEPPPDHEHHWPIDSTMKLRMIHVSSCLVPGCHARMYIPRIYKENVHESAS